ncbi:MAG TPA: NAD(P) transhydrogenase subunit alpha [candidate division Zixibacteria bacterium]|nr:NAD(P) transhydrogenase subunit alpha [candidate division Zixibacteria bacterium]HPA82571.1 NAD(P) transhydrogenase subunit alpha [Thermoanaerobaculales bacterium]MDD4917490.1 NAD(P) transhydrogenase subunit alpha [candidate division Zixibacteria bacterium]MDM7972295.1 NAD(P) transhydrogenase subunit alpha [candidate division Zixibacteria bacterium]HOD67209.1 NAD(P) transhydrogenase subunit alpha [candidate division Zixibacteria bacterium]
MTDLILMLLVFALSFGAGYLLISRVPPLLHTPLMSMTNAVSAVTILGAILLFAVPSGAGERVIGALALITAAFNLVGGFVITDRMTRLFKTQHDPANRTDGA